jgi:3-dehydroquinate synthase
MRKNSLICPVEFTEDTFGESETLAKLLLKIERRKGAGTPRVMIVADNNVVQHTEGLGTKIGRYVQSHGIALAGSPVLVGGGEKVKTDNLQSVLRTVSAMLNAKIGRDDVVLAIGGGAVLDVAGYAAAQVRGGIPIVRMPTTPQAMLDAAFSDYAAMDSSTVKDAIRVRSVPAAVIIDTGFAATILDGVWKGGLGDAVRLALAHDASFFRELTTLSNDYRERDIAALDKIVRDTFAIREKKGASSLALWSAMRLQAMSGYKLPHGYAVSIGVLIELAYAVARGVTDPDALDAAIDIFGRDDALEWISHSRFMLEQTESLSCGADAWKLSSATPAVEILSGVGKTEMAESLDLGIFSDAMNNLVSMAAAR